MRFFAQNQGWMNTEVVGIAEEEFASEDEVSLSDEARHEYAEHHPSSRADK